MEQIISYVKPELMVVSFALYFLGKWMKNSKRIKDKDIPLSLGGIGIIICGMYVTATCDLDSMKNVFMALFTSIVQGIMVAGLSTYVNQIIKQIGSRRRWLCRVSQLGIRNKGSVRTVRTHAKRKRSCG